MTYAIIENEAFSLQHLRGIVERVRPGWRLLFTAETVEEAVSCLSVHENIDVIFIDIELDDGICFDIFDQVRVECPVIFTTAYDSYAIRAFKVNSLDYLLKPIMEADVTAAIAKFERMQSKPQVHIDYGKLFAEMQSQPAAATTQRLLLASGDSIIMVPVANVAFAVSEDKYVYVYLNTGQRHITDYGSLSQLLPVLDSAVFFQLSRSVVARANAITAVRKYFKGRLKVTVQAGDICETVIVSSARKQAFLDWLANAPA